MKHHQQLYTDDFFERHHGFLKIWQIFAAAFGWLLTLLPIGLVVLLLFGHVPTDLSGLLAAKQGIPEAQRIGRYLLAFFIIIGLYTMRMTITQNVRRRHLVEKKPLYDTEKMVRHQGLANSEMTHRFGNTNFRHNVRNFEVVPEKNLNDYEMQQLFNDADQVEGTEVSAHPAEF